MSTKGRDVNNGVPPIRPRGRSPSLKNEIEQKRKSPTPPSILEIKKLLASMEARNAPIYDKPTVCSIIYAQSLKNPSSFDKIKLPRRSLDKSIPKVMSSKTTSDENGVKNSYMKTTRITKPKDPGKPRLPFRSNNSLNVMEKNVNTKKQTRQLTMSLESKSMDVENKPRLSDTLLSSKGDHNIITHEQDDKCILIEYNDTLIVDDFNKQHLVDEDGDLLLGHQMDMCEFDTCSQDNVTMDENGNKEHINDHDSDINQQDQEDNASQVTSSTKVDQENQELEIEHVPPAVDLGSEVVGHEENKPKEPEIKEDSEEVPNKEDPTSKVVAQGKKDTAAYSNVKEEAISVLCEKRRNRVKQLVGIFESVISIESVPCKDD